MNILNVAVGTVAVFVAAAVFLGQKPPQQQVQAKTSSGPEIKLLSRNCTQDYGFATVEGQVQNTTSEPLHNLMVVVTHYTADNVYIKSDSAMVEFQPLMPGQISPYKTIGTGNPLMSKCGVSFKLMGGRALRFDRSGI